MAHLTLPLLAALLVVMSTEDCLAVVRMQDENVPRNIWRGIRPLHSTRDEAERILGRPKRRSLNQAYVYVTDEENIDILYSERPCSLSEIGQWNVAPNTVLRITIHPQRTVLISDLRLDQDKYDRAPDPNIPNWFFWVNRKEGLLIQTQKVEGTEQVMSIAYSSSSEDTTLRCGKIR